MNTKGIKLLVTDLDNTLLRSDKTVSDYTVQVLERVRSCGILIAFATARDFRFVTEYITPRTGITPDILIANNGALACCDGVEICKKMIPSKTINALMAKFRLVRCVSTEDAYYLSGAYSNDHWSIGMKATIITDFSTEITETAFYIDGNTDISTLSLENDYPGVRAVSYSDIDIITVVHHEATKLNALNAVKNALNIQLSEIASFGDDYNDIEVIKNSGFGIAVANAIEEVKAASDFICDTNDNDGVAKWLAKNVF